MGLSPMMQQYYDIKEQYKDCLLMYRLGDFYELFFEDAITTSRELELTLTGRNCGLEERAPMCGVPFHAANSYIAKLVAKGYKVAICEQVEDPKEAKGIVKREVVRIITPGTIDIDEATSANDNLYLASVYITSKSSSIAYADITTGEFTALEIHDNNDNEQLVSELLRIAPKEIIYFDEASSDFIDRYSKQHLKHISTISMNLILNIHLVKIYLCHNLMLLHLFHLIYRIKGKLPSHPAHYYYT